MRIGIDLGGTKTEGILLDSAGLIRSRIRIPSPQGNYAATQETIAQVVTGLDAEAGVICPVGIGIPGTISPATGLVKNANSTWLIGKPLDRDLEKRLGRPVRLANDANCFALSEASDGAGAGYDSVFGVILGTGVGGGLVVNGRPLVGRQAIAGEWGHNPLPWPRDDERPGRSCYCGLSGCIETWLSGPALVADHKTHSGDALTAETIARADTKTGRESLERYIDRLARALASVINILDPGVIVLGGGLSNIGALYDALPDALAPWVFTDRCDTPVLRNIHGDSSGVRGAAWLWPA
ncbi:MAG: ROK family protein [Rhodospirillales bacterium]